MFAIAYDPVHEMIWYVTDDAAGNPVLRGVATANGAVHDTRLPADEGYIGEFSPLKVDPAGAVWLASNVRLLRFDPTSGKLAAIVLASKVSGQLPGATTGSLQGIWPSGIGFLDGLTLVARANVPWLTEYDASLHEVGRIPLPATYAGAKDLIATGSGTLLLLPWQDECFNGGAPLLLMDQTGGVLGHVDIGGDRLYGLGSQILVSGSPGGASLVAGTAVTSVLPSTGAQYCSPNNYFASPTTWRRDHVSPRHGSRRPKRARARGKSTCCQCRDLPAGRYLKRATASGSIAPDDHLLLARCARNRPNRDDLDGRWG